MVRDRGAKGKRMSRFFVDAQDVQGSSIFIRSAEDIRHIVKVLRLREGAKIEVSDSSQWEYEAEICSIDEDEIEARIVDKQKFAREPKTQVTLFQGIPKQSKMETIIQKCVELGVYRIVPVFMDRWWWIKETFPRSCSGGRRFPRRLSNSAGGGLSRKLKRR